MESNLIVIDLDYHGDSATPEDDLIALESKLGKLPKYTLTQKTASGKGRHLIYSAKGITRPVGILSNSIDIMV